MSGDLGDILYSAHTQKLLDKVIPAPRGPEPTFAGLGSLPDPMEPLLDKIEDNLRSIYRDLELIRHQVRNGK